jgi:hypothetical protein
MFLTSRHKKVDKYIIAAEVVRNPIAAAEATGRQTIGTSRGGD